MHRAHLDNDRTANEEGESCGFRAVRPGAKRKLSSAGKERTMPQPTIATIRHFIDRSERPFRAIGWGLLLSLPVWIGMILLFD